MHPIVYVHNSVREKKDSFWGDDTSVIRLNEEYHGGLLGLEGFSHATVLVYLDKARYQRDKHLQRHPRDREDMPLTGIFAQRTKDRPNQIGMTAVEILSVDNASLTVRGLDAIDGTPVLDIKPYFPSFDRRDARTPEWMDRLMENYF